MNSDFLYYITKRKISQYILNFAQIKKFINFFEGNSKENSNKKEKSRKNEKKKRRKWVQNG
jgi:hypothetical protein